MRPDRENYCQTWQRTLRSTCAIAAVIAALGATDAQSAPTYWRNLGTTQIRPSGAQASLREILQSRAEDSKISESTRQQLQSFYQTRQFRPVWSGGLAEQDRAQEALAVLARAEDQGLRSEDYLLPATESRDRPRRAEDVAQYDIALSDAVLRYARDVSIGRVRPNDIFKDVKLPAQNFNAVDVLTRMSRSRSISAVLADLQPPHAEYRRLAQAMARYREVAAKGGWPSLPARGDIGFDPKDRRTKALVERLAAEDPELAATTDPSADTIKEAVKRFQSRNGLEQDGRVGGATLAALNVPLATRMNVVAANMERWRWLPRTFEDRYIAVNVPDQSVTFVRNGEVVLSSRVIVGRKNSRTPIVRAEAVALIANPPWEVPGDIVVNQMLPKLRRSSGYLQASNMVLINAPNDPFGRKVNWRNISPATFPYKVVQLPGPQNALGNLMIDTPNDFDVYLHDTPGKQLFKSADRAVSNGCIRVEGIHELAPLVLDEADGETKITDAIAARDTKRIELSRPVPVYFLYWTAIAGPDGAVGFRGDLYGRDAPLIAALAAPPTEERELVSDAETTTPDSVSGSRVSSTLLPATAGTTADSERSSDPALLDERGSELPPLDEQGVDVAPQESGSATQNGEVAGAVRRANERTRFTDSTRRTEATRPSEPTGVRRTWPSDDVRYRRNNRSVDAEGPFPLLKRLFDGSRPQDPYRRR